ncbi:hypothetical protein MHU86_4556 [Fragilaria crotonensis]|nr:hypothetical protein MHU86_4556 [Fragilaria crotonensis]
MTEMEQAKIIIDNFGGNDDPESICYLDQFVNGLGRFAGLFTSSEPDESGQIFLTMPQKLHRQRASYICRTNFHHQGPLVAEEFHKHHKDYGSDITQKGTTGGANVWNLNEKKRHDNLGECKKLRCCSDFAGNYCCGIGGETTSRQEGDREKSIFQIRRRLLGMGSLGAHTDSGWGSDGLYAFNESKVDTSFGRGTHTRTAMRKAAMAASMPPVDNRRGKKREIDVMQPPENAVELDLWKNTLKHLEAEALEKQEKQHHSMRLRIIRDKLAARRGKREVILQQLTLSSKFRKKPDDVLLEKMQSNEDEIEKLELELEKQQQSECDRQSRVLEEKRSTVKLSIEMATPMIGTSGSFGSSGIESSTSEDNENGSGRGGNDRITRLLTNDTKNDDADGNKSTPRANTPMSITTSTCTECNLMPSNHTCLKCKRVRVCSVCCDTNRGLQNNPWCKTCFDNETPASQTRIRNGDYNYRW